jgi:hypothetical protein
MQTPHPNTYPVIQIFFKFSVTRCFFGHFKVESRVTSVAWADARCLPIQIFLILLFQTSLLDWKCWKINVKSCSGPLKGPPWGAKKRQKSVMQ